MKQAILIRQYQQDDLADLLSAWEGANSLAHPFLCEDYVAQVRRDIPALYIPNADTWVAEKGGLVVGFIALLGNEVGAIFVSPEFHGSGIGIKLMNKARQLQGNLELEVFTKNQIGRRFYQRYGFETMVEKYDKPSAQRVLRLQYVAQP